MVKPGIARDLALLTAAKLLVLAVIYIALFAPFADRGDDTAAHLLGSPGWGAPSPHVASGGP